MNEVALKEENQQLREELLRVRGVVTDVVSYFAEKGVDLSLAQVQLIAQYNRKREQEREVCRLARTFVDLPEPGTDFVTLGTDFVRLQDAVDRLYRDECCAAPDLGLNGKCCNCGTL